MTRFFPVAFSLALFIVASAFAGNIPVPPDLDPGAPYHLVFVSSVGRNATSSDIGHYDSHVQQAADAAGIGVKEGVTWYAIGSTESVDARDHAPVSAPVYNMQMERLANDYEDMWGGLLSSPIKYDEHGIDVGVEWVWTGTYPHGQAHIFYPLGGGGGSNKQAGIGASHKSVNAWLYVGEEPFEEDHRVYGLSSRLTVIPEPASVLLLSSLGAVTVVGFAWRRRRKLAA